MMERLLLVLRRRFFEGEGFEYALANHEAGGGVAVVLQDGGAECVIGIADLLRVEEKERFPQQRSAIVHLAVRNRPVTASAISGARWMESVRSRCERWAGCEEPCGPPPCGLGRVLCG